jgi:hypothetical protein
VSYEGEGALNVKTKFYQNSGNYKSDLQTIFSVAIQICNTLATSTLLWSNEL